MVYRVAGITGENNTGVKLGFVQFEVTGKNWAYELKTTAFFPYNTEWKQRLADAAGLSVADYLYLHTDYGKLLGDFAKQFILEKELQYQVQLIASPGLNILAAENNPHCLGDGAAVAALTGINTVSDFKNMDAALGGKKAELLFENSLPLNHEADAQLIYACFFAVLRWREENNLLAVATGAARDSIGGAVWIGQEW